MMSQGNKRLRSSQHATNKSASQKVPRKTSPKKSPTAGSSSQNQAINTDLVNKFVRYILLKMGASVPIKKSEIVKCIFKEKPGKSYEEIVKKASTILRDVYGLALETIDSDTSNKKYVVTNLLQPNLTEVSDSDDFKTTVTFLVLTHIFMCKNEATDTSLWKFLKELDIKPDLEIEGVGVVQTFVTKTLVKQQYVIMDNSGGQHDDGQAKKTFSWGSQAEKCVSKMDILKFVSKVYHMDEKSWTDQCEEASHQFSESEE